jgi:hypothetical protein
VVQAHQYVPVGETREAFIEVVQGIGTEAPLAVARFREPRLEHDDRPASGDERARDLERRMTEAPAQFAGRVVVARDEQDGRAEVVEREFQRAVGRGFVLHEVAGDHDRIGREVAAAGMGQTGLQARQRGDPPDPSQRVVEQVGVRELQQTH